MTNKDDFETKIKYITLREALEFVAYGEKPLEMAVINEKKQIPLNIEETCDTRVKIINAINDGTLRIRAIFGDIKIVLDKDMEDKYMVVTTKNGDEIFRSLSYDFIDGEEYFPGMREEKIITEKITEVEKKVNQNTKSCRKEIRTFHGIEKEISRNVNINPNDLRRYRYYRWDYNLILQNNAYSGSNPGDFLESEGYAFIEVEYKSLLKLLRGTIAKLKKNEKEKFIQGLAQKLPESVVELSNATKQIMLNLPDEYKGETGWGIHTIRRSIENMQKKDGSPRFVIDVTRGCKPKYV